MMGNSHIVWTPGTTLDQIERQAIELAYAFYRGNKSATARSLDINIRTLEMKLKRFAADDIDHARRTHDEAEDRKRRLALQRGEVYSPIPYTEPEEDVEASPDGDTIVLEDGQIEPARAKLKDAPPAIPPSAPLSAKVVGAR